MFLSTLSIYNKINNLEYEYDYDLVLFVNKPSGNSSRLSCAAMTSVTEQQCTLHDSSE